VARVVPAHLLRPAAGSDQRLESVARHDRVPASRLEEQLRGARLADVLQAVGVLEQRPDLGPLLLVDERQELIHGVLAAGHEDERADAGFDAGQDRPRAGTRAVADEADPVVVHLGK
jgi:hypothetical protein